MTVLGRLPWSSNATFLVDIGAGGSSTRAVYKPGRGERPLWDYPPALYRRERAVYLVSEILGWGLVPETVIRDGEFGEGSVQRFVTADFGEHYFSLIENARHHETLRAIGLLDLVVNNGDRKSGHFLLATNAEVGEADGEVLERLGEGDPMRVWAIDHGLCLHADDKLRTVVWDFAGTTFAEQRLPDVGRLASQLAEPEPAAPEIAELRDLLDSEEIAALARRATDLVRHPVFPLPRSGRSYPWPLV